MSVNALLLLQIAVQHPSYFIHFLQLTGPETELQAAATAAAGGPMNNQQQQQQQGPSTDYAFLQMLRSMPACDNITYDAFAAGVWALRRTCQQRSGPAAVTVLLLLLLRAW